MGNKHVNGNDPYVMSPSEAAKEAQSWVEHGGTVRYDEENKHSTDAHYHLIDNNPNEDLLIIIDPSLEDDKSPEKSEDESSDSSDDGED